MNFDTEELFYSVSSCLLITVVPIFFVFAMPHKGNLKVWLAFAVGGLLGDAFLHLIPHAMEQQEIHRHDVHGKNNISPLEDMKKFFQTKTEFWKQNLLEHFPDASSSSCVGDTCPAPYATSHSHDDHDHDHEHEHDHDHDHHDHDHDHHDHEHNEHDKDDDHHDHEHHHDDTHGHHDHDHDHHDHDHNDHHDEHKKKEGIDHCHSHDHRYEHDHCHSHSNLEHHDESFSHSHSHDHEHDGGHNVHHHGHGHDHEHDVSGGLWILAGIIGFFILDQVVRQYTDNSNGHGHSHSHGGDKKTEVNDEKINYATIILNLIADFAHNFTDGLAIGGTWAVDSRQGLVTTLAILFHEVPHEVGDFAILLQNGLSKWAVVKTQLFTGFGSLVGTIIGNYVGNSTVDTSWIPNFTAGGFIYIALVSVMPELLEDTDLLGLFKQVLAMGFGIWLMVVITWFE